MKTSSIKYILDYVIDDEIANASSIQSINNVDASGRCKKSRKRCHFVMCDGGDDISDEAKDLIVNEFSKYIVHQVKKMQKLFPGRSVVDILYRIKDMELISDSENITEVEGNNINEVNCALNLEI